MSVPTSLSTTQKNTSLPAQAQADRAGKTRVYIVDDCDLIRFGIRTVISTQPDLEICGESDGGAACLDEIFKLEPDVILLDISLRSNSGIHIIKTLRTTLRALRIIVITFQPESAYGVRAIKAGAHGYLLKHDAAEHLLAAIRRVRTGGISISDTLATHMLHRFSHDSTSDATSLFQLLSDRELEIAQHIGAGMTTKEIALKLRVSVKTIETHRMHLKEKLNLQNATQLVQACTRWVEENRSAARHVAARGAA